MEYAEVDLTIVYDTEYTERAANVLSNGLQGKYTCVVQRYSVYEKDKDAITNNNRIIFVFEEKKKIWQYLFDAECSEFKIDYNSFGSVGPVYAYLYSSGNWRGVWVDVEKTIYTASKEDRLLIFAWKCSRFMPSSLESFINFKTSFYTTAIQFFLKEENLKLILPD